MKTFFLQVYLFLQTIVCYSQVEHATITFAPLELLTTYSIPAQDFELRLGSLSNTIEFSSQQEIDRLSRAIYSIKDTIHQERVPDKVVYLPNGRKVRFIMYPNMDTRGKISVNFKNGNSKTYYYDRWTIWDATEDQLFNMTEPFMSFIRSVANK